METTEEKAKAYDEALEKAKELYNRGYTSITGEIFPELAESNDEKIRKVLIKFFSMGAKYNQHTDGIADKDIIAWLEKQGEKKPEENKGNIGGISPNWSEEDKGIIEGVVSYLINYSNIVESKEDADRIEYLIDKIQDICPHQKQEWSEEDEQHIDSLLKRLDALCRNKFERTRFAISEDRDWLKSLKGRVQPKQEWSEEDSQYIDDAFTLIGFGLSTHTTGEVQEWLLSLKGRVKPQWKPSDEQIAQLQIVIDTYGNEGIYDPILTELLFQLKKLRGKV